MAGCPRASTCQSNTAAQKTAIQGAVTLVMGRATADVGGAKLVFVQGVYNRGGQG